MRRGLLSELATQATGTRLLLIAPGEAIALHQVPLPSRKRSTWARAVPYALEDQVVEDIEALHFALGGMPDGDRLPVAVVNRDALRGWLDACAQAGLVPVAVIPEPLLLPWQEGDWSILLEERRAVVRTGRWEGFATERNLLELLLNQAIAEVGDAKPQRLRLWGNPPPVLTEAGLEPRIEDSAPEPLQVFASAYQPATAITCCKAPTVHRRTGAAGCGPGARRRCWRARGCWCKALAWRTSIGACGANRPPCGPRWNRSTRTPYPARLGS